MKVVLGKLVVLFILIGCKHEEFVPCETPIPGSLIVDTNYPNWNNSSCYYHELINGKITFFFSSIDDLCNVDQFSLNSIERIDGKVSGLHSVITNPLNDGFIILNELSGDDAVIGNYILNKNYPNEFVIQSYDSIKNEILGKFDLQFVPDKEIIPTFNDTIYFRNSTFTAKLVK